MSFLQNRIYPGDGFLGVKKPGFPGKTWFLTCVYLWGNPVIKGRKTA